MAERYEVTWSDKNPPKPILPVLPTHDDATGQAMWTTAVFHLDPVHPIFEGVHQGPQDGSGHVEMRRYNAPCLRFEPARHIGDGNKLADALVWQTIQTDQEPYPWSNPQAKKIAYVVRLLCGSTRTRTTQQESALVVTTFLEAGACAEGFTTYGTTAQRYEAAVELRGGRFGQATYLLDENTGEYVIRVSDLAKTAREVIGGSLERGWLDARMEDLGFVRRSLEGHEQHGREGRRGPHARADVYRGLLPDPSPDDVDPLPPESPDGPQKPVTT